MDGCILSREVSIQLRNFLWSIPGMERSYHVSYLLGNRSVDEEAGKVWLPSLGIHGILKTAAISRVCKVNEAIGSRDRAIVVCLKIFGRKKLRCTYCIINSMFS